MDKSIKRSRRKKSGLPPGSVVFTGTQMVEKANIHYFLYDHQSIEEKVFDSHQEIELKQSFEDQIDWYDVRGLHDIALIEAFGKAFNIHSLILEDIVDPHQRPKFEEYQGGNFIILRALHFDKEKVEIKTEQVAIYFRKGLLLSFQETETDLFPAIRQRLTAAKGKIRSRGADYLAYALMDSIVDHYYFVLDELEDEIDKLEEKILGDPDATIKEKVHLLKREFLVIRKSIAPLREAISRFSKSESEFIEDSSNFFIRDLYDHTVQIMDLVETYRDMLNGLQDLYLSEISFKMNQVMQVLAVVTTVFVPISFLAGLYGMNFKHIPELENENGYFYLLGVMAIIFVGALSWFKWKKWF